MKKHIPNLITSLNLAAGFFAIILATEGDLLNASWLILAAMIFDFLDGFSARLLKAYSAIGRELDSLADVVSFGVAPAVILYRLIGTTLAPDGMTLTSAAAPFATILLLTPVLMAVCAAVRLAVFNTDESQTTSFKGLPTPANALAVISIVITQGCPDSVMSNFLTQSFLPLIIYTVILSVLMVTRIPLLSLKFSNLKLKGNEGRYLILVLVAAALIIFGIGAAPLIIPIYIISSLVTPLFG